MVSITRRAKFSASHFCSDPELSPEENRALYGKAAGPNGHGHNYVIEVTVADEVDPVCGMVMNLKQLKEVLEREVVEPFDHRFLNHEVPAENLGLEIQRWLKTAWAEVGPVRLSRICLEETGANSTEIELP